MFSPYTIVSNQIAPHPNTESCAEKHASTNYSRPISPSQYQAFEETNAWVKKTSRRIIIDSGCGTGDSTFWLSEKNPDLLIVGIDQSLIRITKAKNKLAKEKKDNVFFIRARLEDFWRLAYAAKWAIDFHYLLYPNPWPKSIHHPRRWHGHPVFPLLLSMSPHLEIRSNWLIYLEEFSLAAKAISGRDFRPAIIENPDGISAFEKKYAEHKVSCYVLQYHNENRITLPDALYI